jgi:hypothetical protein
MRILSLAGCGALIMLATPLFAADTKDFSLTVDGTEIGINSGETITAKTKSGAEVQIVLKRNETATYADGRISFQHRSDLSVANSEIDKGIRQQLVTTALGTLVLVQQYDSIDPSTLTQLMLQQLTKDEVAVGAKLDTAAATRKLADGTELKGLSGKVVNKKEEIRLEVLAVGDTNSGVLAVTRVDGENAKTDQGVIDQFWSTLVIKPLK